MRRADQQRHWTPRPVAAATLRAALVVVPVVVSFAAALAVARFVGRPADLAGRIGFAVALLVTAAATLVIAQRWCRRVMPLAMLLPMSLAPSDQIPSRFRVALRAANLSKLRDWAGESATADRAGEPLGVILSLAAALNAHDRRTRGHSDRVRGFAQLIGEELGLSQEEQARLRWAALLHDIGKLRVPAVILNAPGRPSPAQWATIQLHPSAGLELAGPLVPWMGEWIHGIDQHHERVDGSGYPAGLAGDQITLAGRIVSVADAFETMTAIRSYKRPMSVAAARAELAACAGTHFDPRVVRAFLAVSIGRMRWRTGALTALAEVPVIGEIASVFSQTVALSISATGGFAALVGAAALVASSSGLPAHPTATTTTTTSVVRPATTASPSGHPGIARGGIAATPSPSDTQPSPGGAEPGPLSTLPNVNLPPPTVNPTVPTIPPVTIPPPVKGLTNRLLPGGG